MLVDAAAAGARGAALFALADRRLEPAHAGRLLHHGHAGFRADGVLRGVRTTRTPRRRHGRHLSSTSNPTLGPVRLELDKPTPSTTSRLRMLLLVFAFLRRSPARRSAARSAGIRVNEHRMRAIGYPHLSATSWPPSPWPVRCAGRGRLPVRRADRLHQPRAHELPHDRRTCIMMVILGGIGHFAAPSSAPSPSSCCCTMFQATCPSSAASPASTGSSWMGLLPSSPASRCFRAGRSACSGTGVHASQDVLATATSAACSEACTGDRASSRRAHHHAASVAWPPSTTCRSTSSAVTVHAVIGTNGAGKSTLINILSGELPASDRRGGTRSART